MGPQPQGTAQSVLAVEQAQFQRFGASGPSRVDPSGDRTEQDQQQGPPGQLRGQLAQHQPETTSTGCRQGRQQHRQGAAGGDTAPEPQNLAFGIATIPDPAALFQPVVDAVEDIKSGLGGVHIHHGGAVLAGGAQEENQADGQEDGEQQGGLESRGHGCHRSVAPF